MENKIAILLTTFIRDQLLFKTLQSIIENYTSDCILLIADQGYSSEEKKITIEYTQSQIPCKYYTIPFDSGLSYARNFLVNKAKELEISYCLLMADSLQFMKEYDFSSYINFLENNTEAGIVGFDLDNYGTWRGNLELIPNKYFYIDISKETHIIYKDLILQPVDHVSNIFLAKTQTLIENPWDDELKLMEYEDFFWRLKTNTKYKVYWTDRLQFHYTKNRNNEYEQYRNRATREFRKLVEQKYKIERWVHCTPTFLKFVRKPHAKKEI